MLDFSFSVPGGPGERADRLVLAAAPRPVSRAAVAECFARGGVALAETGRPVGKADRLPPGAGIVVRGLAEAADRAARPEPGAFLRVVWENPDLLALDKPAAQACHPLSPDEKGTLAGALLARYPETAEAGPDPLQPGLVHRIDAGTSGLVLAARSRAAFDFVRAQFSAQTVRKTYLALVAGSVARAGGASGHLAHVPSFRGRMRVVSPRSLPRGEKPLFAETFWKPLAPGPGGTTLLEVSIRTGVTHQIRCHLAAAGHPVVGDATYGGPAPGAVPLPAGGHCLHSLSAELELPGAPGRRVTLAVPAPAWAPVSSCWKPPRALSTSTGANRSSRAP